MHLQVWHQKDSSCFLKSWNLNLNSSFKTPTSIAYFSVFKDIDLAISFKAKKCEVFCSNTSYFKEKLCAHMPKNSMCDLHVTHFPYVAYPSYTFTACDKHLECIPRCVPIPKQSILCPCSLRLRMVSSLMSFEATIFSLANQGMLYLENHAIHNIVFYR
jgi:hypothetical protein